tara:strand:- start:311 stop:481 length:171 start_codon:yes stop_codon:yes gene_type:complete
MHNAQTRSPTLTAADTRAELASKARITGGVFGGILSGCGKVKDDFLFNITSSVASL